MPSGKEIRNKIKSVENTRKITKAMEMVAASKMRKAQERMRASRPYGEKIRRVAGHLSHALTDYRHPFLVKRDPVKNVGLIVITSDKGLCGGLNSNLLRQVLIRLKEWQAASQGLQVTTIGNKGLPHCRASLKAPFLKVPSSPVSLRVPSGKISTGRPCASAAVPSSTICRMAFDPLSRSMMIIGELRRNQPKTGSFTSSFFVTIATSGNRTRHAIVSQVD